MYPNASDPSQTEQAGLATLAGEEQAFQARLNSFVLSSGSASSNQIQGYLDELNAFLGRFWAYRATANALLAQGRPAYSQKLEQLIQRVQSNLQTYQFTLRSRRAYEVAMGPTWPAPGGTPGMPPYPSPYPQPGSPEYFDAVMGRRCYWCGQDLTGLPQPVGICPRCGRFPGPPPR